jgi:myo-inositol-1(or 4)-monophosphatase
MNLKQITEQLIVLSKSVGGYIIKESEKFKDTDIEEKGIHDLVSYVDKNAEKQLVEELKRILPEAGFIAEEDQSLKKGEIYNWIVDPLDGTTNFIHSVPIYSISIALNKGDETIVGLVYEIKLDECFYSWKGAPAFLNGKEISVSKQNNIADSLIATGFPYYNYSLIDQYLELLKDLMQTSRGIRRLGSAAVDLAYVAAGRFEVFYEYSLHPWDVAAGAFLVKQAGGKVTDFKGGSNYIFGEQIISSNKNTYDEFFKKLSFHFNK